MIGHNVSNLAVHGWEWEDKESSTRFQITAFRDIQNVPRFSMKASEATEWTTTPMADLYRVNGSWQSFQAMLALFFKMSADAERGE